MSSSLSPYMATQKLRLQNDPGFSLEENILKGFETPIDLISFNIGEVLLDAFDKNPTHVSQIDATTGRKTTLAEMKDRVLRCAMWMEKERLNCDDIVALCTPQNIDAYIPNLATQFVQAISSAWTSNIQLAEARRLLRLFKPKLIFARAQEIDVLEEAMSLENLTAKMVVFGEHPKYPSLDDIIESQPSKDVENYSPRTRKSPQEAAVILLSSGTTGVPKGCVVSAEAMLKNAVTYKFNLKHKIVLWKNVINCSMVLTCILHNGTRIISDNSTDPRIMCRVLEKYKVNYARVSPRMLNELANFEEMDQYNWENLEVLQYGGMKLHQSAFKKLKSSCLGDRLYQSYGASEIGTARILPILSRKQKSHHSVGFVGPHIQVKIVDRATKRILGPNAPGEMLIKTPNMIMGYYKNIEAFKKAIDPEGWFHTGDVAYYDQTGEIFVVGRIAYSFIHSGHEFFACEIQDLLWTHPAVTDAAVITVQRKSEGAIPVAFVTIRPGENVTEQELINFTLRTSEKFKALCMRVYFIDTIPITSSIKVNKGYLKDLYFKLNNEHE